MISSDSVIYVDEDVFSKSPNFEDQTTKSPESKSQTRSTRMTNTEELVYKQRQDMYGWVANAVKEKPQDDEVHHSDMDEKANLIQEEEDDAAG